VAHELKNPLTSLRSAIEMAARPDLDQERRTRLMAIVMDDINRLNRLISDISDASRLDAELMRGEVKPVDLEALLPRHGPSPGDYGQPEVRGSRSSFVSPPTRPLRRNGHDGRYGQVFRNVIDNALSFSPPGTRIVVELGREPRNGPFVVTIDDEGQASPRTISNRSSSGSIRNVRPSISASTPASASRSAGRSWKPTAARSRPPIATPPTAGYWARASPSACRPRPAAK
jgi:signal transduction histidine kinase